MLENLKEDQTYTVKIAARTNSGLGFWSKEYVIGKCLSIKLTPFLSFRVMEVGGWRGYVQETAFVPVF